MQGTCCYRGKSLQPSACHERSWYVLQIPRWKLIRPLIRDCCRTPMISWDGRNIDQYTFYRPLMYLVITSTCLMTAWYVQYHENQGHAWLTYALPAGQLDREDKCRLYHVRGSDSLPHNLAILSSLTKLHSWLSQRLFWRLFTGIVTLPICNRSSPESSSI